MKPHLDAIMKGINGLTGMLDAVNKDFAKNMTPEQAKDFHEQFMNANIDQKIEDVKQQAKDLKRDFKID